MGRVSCCFLCLKLPWPGVFRGALQGAQGKLVVQRLGRVCEQSVAMGGSSEEGPGGALHGTRWAACSMMA